MWYKILLDALARRVESESQNTAIRFSNDLCDYLLRHFKEENLAPELSLGIIDKMYHLYEDKKAGSVPLVDFARDLFGLAIVYSKSSCDQGTLNEDFFGILKAANMASTLKFRKLENPVFWIRYREREVLSKLKFSLKVDLNHVYNIIIQSKSDELIDNLMSDFDDLKRQSSLFDGFINRLQARKTEPKPLTSPLPPAAKKKPLPNPHVQSERFLSGATAFHKAVMKGRPEIIHQLVAKGDIDINTTQIDETTALHIAAKHGYLFVVEALLENKANIHAASKDNSTALHLAALKGHTDVAEMLLAKGAKVDALRQDQSTPLHLAAKSVHADMVNLLLEQGANVNAPTSDGYTALHFAAKSNNPISVNMLLAKGADIHAALADGSTALHLAAGQGNNGVVKVLLANGAEANAELADGSTALQLAAKNGHADVVLALLANGVNINDAHKALRLAQEKKHETVVTVFKLDSLILKITATLTSYELLRTAEGDHCWQGLFKGYTKKQKLEAVAALQQLLKGNFSGNIGKHLAVLQQGRLGARLLEIAMSPACAAIYDEALTPKNERNTIAGLIHALETRQDSLIDAVDQLTLTIEKTM